MIFRWFSQISPVYKGGFSSKGTQLTELAQTAQSPQFTLQAHQPKALGEGGRCTSNWGGQLMAYGTKMAWVMSRAKHWIRTRGSSARSHQLGSINFGHSLGAKTLGPEKVHSWALNMGCHQQLGAEKEQSPDSPKFKERFRLLDQKGVPKKDAPKSGNPGCCFDDDF